MLRRLGVYFVAMFPPWIMIPAGALHFVAIELGLQALAGERPLVLSWRSLVGTLGVVLFQLALRVQDELKDLETDRALAAAGDPKYVERALVTGRVLPRDLVFLRWAALAALVPVSALLGHLALGALGVVAVLVVASYHWFFVPSMKSNLLLAFVTHNPLAAAISCWCVAACAPEVPAAVQVSGAVGPWVALLVVGLWAPVAAWEVARKIRVPEDETAYATYSKLLGARTAALATAAFVVASAVALGLVGARASIHPGYFALLAGSALVPVGRAVLFVFAPTRARAKLQPTAELYAALAGLGFIVALALEHGART